MPGKGSGKSKGASREPELDLQQPSLSEADSSPNLSEEEIAEIGQRAATALSDPLWSQTFKLTLNQIVARWLQSDVNATRERENLWHQAQNLFALEEVLMGQVNALQQINLTKAEQAEEDLNHYENIQGFGLEDILDGMDTIEPH